MFYLSVLKFDMMLLDLIEFRSLID